jgi:putative membrane protein
VRRLHPSTVFVAFVPAVWDAVRSLAPALLVSVATGKRDFTELVLAAMGIFGGFGAVMAYFTTRFGIEGNELVWRTGWLFKKDRRISLDHINNVNMRQGLLERLFKVVTVEVETAAGHGAELKLQVLSQADAESLRSELLSAVQQAPDAEQEAQPEQVYRVSKSDLWLGAMTENQGVQLLLVMLTFVGGAVLVRFILTATTFTAIVPAWALGLMGAFAVGVVILGGWVYGAVTYALKFGAFTVRAEPGTYRISHGLLTKVQYVLRTERVEFASVSATIWQKWLGRTTLRIGTAGSFGEHGQLVPLALMVPEGQALQLAGSLLHGESLEALSWQRFPRYYVFVSFVRMVIALIVASLVLYGLSFVPRLASGWLGITSVGIIVLMVITGIDTIISYRVSGYAISDKLIAVRRGFFKRTTSLMPLARIEVTGTSQPTWWQRRGVTTLAGHGMVHAIVVPMLPRRDADEVVERVKERAPAY